MRKVEKVEKITRVKGSIPKDIRKLIKTEFPAYTNCTPTNPLIIAKSSIVSLFIFSSLTKKKMFLWQQDINKSPQRKSLFLSHAFSFSSKFSDLFSKQIVLALIFFFSFFFLYQSVISISFAYFSNISQKFREMLGNFILLIFYKPLLFSFSMWNCWLIWISISASFVSFFFVTYIPSILMYYI